MKQQTQQQKIESSLKAKGAERTRILAGNVSEWKFADGSVPARFYVGPNGSFRVGATRRDSIPVRASVKETYLSGLFPANRG